MPTRMIRESLLDSPRYMDCTESEQLLFVHLMLLADDFGCLSLAPAFISRRAFSERPGHARLMRMLQALADADLIRIYEVGGSRFAFIPRFGQRLRQMTLHNPLPPEALLNGDEDAQKKFTIFKTMNPRMSVNRPSTVGHLPAEGKRREEKRSEVPSKAGINPAQEQPLDPTEPLALKAKQAGLQQGQSETRGQFALRVAQASVQQTARKSKFDD